MDYNYNKRDEVPVKYRWDLTKWFKTDKDWYQALKKVKEGVLSLEKYKGKIFESDNLYNILAEYYIKNNEISALYVYAMLHQDEDLSVDKYSKMLGEISSVEAKFEESTSFMIPEILHSSEFDIATLIKKCPKLERFCHVLEVLAEEKAHIKDEETEKTISILTKDMDHYENISCTILNSNLDYGKVKNENGELVSLNTGNYRLFASSRNRNIRKSAYLKMNKKRAEFSNILGKNLLAFMSRHASISRIRGYKSTKEMDFKRDSVPLEVHESLLKNMNKGLPLFKEYYHTYQKILGIDNLKPYDLNAPVTDNEKRYTIEEAEKYVYEATKILGPKYSEIIKQGFKEHWIDYTSYKGKQSGGYCCSLYGYTPNILMSYNSLFDSISTIAHEMGHATRAVLSFKNNSIEYSSFPLYITEIPSLLNEVLLTEYVINGNFSKEEKINVINKMLKTICSNFYTAIMENELENIVYARLDQDEALTSNDLNDIMTELIKKYYGPSLAHDKYFKYMWTARSHYFSPWYLYKYATCICGAVYFASKILKGDNDILNMYNEFLASPSDKFPNDILMKYGIDLTNSKIYDELFDYFKNLLNKLKELTNVGDLNE